MQGHFISLPHWCTRAAAPTTAPKPPCCRVPLQPTMSAHSSTSAAHGVRTARGSLNTGLARGSLNTGLARGSLNTGLARGGLNIGLAEVLNHSGHTG